MREALVEPQIFSGSQKLVLVVIAHNVPQRGQSMAIRRGQKLLAPTSVFLTPRCDDTVRTGKPKQKRSACLWLASWFLFDESQT